MRVKYFFFTNDQIIDILFVSVIFWGANFSLVDTVQYHLSTLNLLLNYYKLITTKRIILLYFCNFSHYKSFFSTFTYWQQLPQASSDIYQRYKFVKKYWFKIFMFITIKSIQFLMTFTCLESTSFYLKLYDWYFPSFPNINLKWCKRTSSLEKNVYC